MPHGFYKKKGRGGKYWYCRVRLPDGRSIVRSTGCTDLSAARLAHRRLEQQALAEANATENQAAPHALGQALADFIADRERKGRAEGTVEMYTTKAGHLIRLLGKNTDINLLNLEDTETYVDARQTEGAGQGTIHKELVTYYGTIRLAIKKGLCHLRLEDVKLDGFSAKYKPRDRRLTVKELQALEAQFATQPERARHVRFLVLTGASWGESVRCERRDVDLDNGYLYLPGTKRETRKRRLPISLLPGLAELLSVIVDELPSDQQRLFSAWDNVRRALRSACKRAKIDAVSPNDLRRTFGSWLKNRGLDSAVIARLMGHSSTRMVDLVYGKLDDDTLADAMGRLGDIPLGAVPGQRCTNLPEDEQRAVAAAGATLTGGSNHGSRQEGLQETSATSGQSSPNRPDQQLKMTMSSTCRKAPRKEATPPTFAGGAAMPRDRVEPPTRGFSVPCSTD